MTRILLYTGKGGVGKTSIAAASAVLSSDLGKKTIVLSTDIAHSLGDAFGLKLGPEPTEIAPNLWAGVGLVRGGAGTALVGSHGEVTERILEYHRLGIDEFILSGYPNLEEAYSFGEGVLPLLARLGHWRHPTAGVVE